MTVNIKVAVLGANGQIGSVLIKRLSGIPGIHPVAICRNALGAGLISDVECDVRLGSVTSEKWDTKLIGDCDSVINCIWPQGPVGAVKRQNGILLANVRGSDNLKKFISLSSVAVYGTCIDASWSTFNDPKPDLTYGQAKLEMEKLTADCFAGSACRYHLVRLGHVYGHEQWLSRMIIGAISDNKFRLPFDGSMLSNALHVDEVAQGLIHLLLEDQKSGFINLASQPQKTWRHIFNRHSEVCGLPAVKLIDHDLSVQYRNSFIAASRKRPWGKSLDSFSGWLRSISPLALLDFPDVKVVGSLMLDRFPGKFERRIKALSAIRMVKGQVRSLKKESGANPLFCCDAMPGKYLEIPPLDLSILDDQKKELRQWYQRAIVGPIG